MTGIVRRIAFLLAAAVLSVAAAVPCAFAVQPEGQPLGLEGPDSVSMAFLDVRELPFQTSPDVIEVGITCGMEGMCGQHPCLCGSADAWGTCSCNGLEERRAAFSLAGADGSDLGFVHVVQAFGRTWLVTLGSGEAAAVLSAELEHYAPASADVHVSAAPFGPLDALKIAALLAAVAIAVFVVVQVVRALVRALRRAHQSWRTRRARHAGRPGKRS